jgi:hypothetical protein
MQTLVRHLTEWFHQVYSLQLVFLLVLLAAAIATLVRGAKTLPDRAFVALSIVVGVLGLLAVGAGFRTLLVARLLWLVPGGMAERSLGWFKAILALGAALLSMYEGRLLAQKKSIRPVWSKGIAIALALLAIGAYFRFGDPGYSNFYHRWEFFHYYLGSKYDRELGYTRIYQCAAIAQADSGQADEVKARKLRDLTQEGLLVPASAALAHPEDCRGRFSSQERWEAFKADVKFFRDAAGLKYWNDMQTDHGYNPPPVWTVMGHVWASLHPATDGYIKFLASFDLLFLLGMFAAIYWAFRWRVFAVAAIFWGCQLPAEYFWTGGAFMRQDWLFFLVLSACLVRKRHHALGGAAFAYSTLLRVFPGLLLAGWAVVASAYAWKHKRMAPHHFKVLLGGLGATAVLFSISVGVAGWRSYPEFWEHIQLHTTTPLTNNMGLPTLLAHSIEGRMELVRNEKHVDPFDDWKRMRRNRLRESRVFYVLLLAAIAAAFVHVVRRVKSLVVAQALSLAIVVSLVELTCYYYSMFILSAFLSRLRRGVEQWVLCVAGTSQLLAINRYLSFYYDDRYTTQAALFCVFAFSLLFAHWPRKAKAPVRSPATAGSGPQAAGP